MFRRLLVRFRSWLAWALCWANSGVCGTWLAGLGNAPALLSGARNWAYKIEDLEERLVKVGAGGGQAYQ